MARLTPSVQLRRSTMRRVRAAHRSAPSAAMACSAALRREVSRVADGLWQVYFGPLALGGFDERLLRIEDRYGYIGRNPRRVLPMSSD
jgi:hypothetical protein